MTSKKVLVTGMSGLIGQAVQKRLDGKYQLRALNRRPIEGVECFQADISALDAIRPAFEGVDVVVHLAATWRGNPTWDEYLKSGVIGTYNILEASRSAGVSRVVYASSGAAIRGYEMVFPYDAIAAGRYGEVPNDFHRITHEDPTRPTNIYGATKVWGEALGRVYSESYNMSVICLRIGVVNREDRPLEPRHIPIWCSQRDLATMVEKCIEAPDNVKFDIFHVCSNNKWCYRDLEHARQVLGYVPQDSADSFQRGS
jgi:nucleoside-diphosphate-sugar epimerase